MILAKSVSNPKQVIDDLLLGRIFWKNPSSILGGNNFWSDFTYFAAELWITRPPSLKTRRLKKSVKV
jgi:hypothetical protein